jgi:hypothetical protein
MDNTKKVVIKGVVLSCHHCGSGSFTHRRSQLNTAAMTFFDLDWLNASADIYVCTDCGYLHWFLGAPVAAVTEEHDVSGVIPVDDTSTESDCLACSTVIPAGSDTCSACGWSYRLSENSD